MWWAKCGCADVVSNDVKRCSFTSKTTTSGLWTSNMTYNSCQSVLDMPAPMLNPERSVKAKFYCPCAVSDGLTEK